MDTKHNIQEYFETALHLVKEAGKVVKEGFVGVKTVTTKLGPWDLVTEYDRRVEEALTAGLKKKFPDHMFIGEESASESKSKPQLTDCPTWITDPIDGTNNFVHGLQITCISIGLCINKEIIIGIIYNPILDQLFTACIGQGAFLNGDKIQASKVKDLTKSLLCVEISFARQPNLRELVMKRTEALVSVAHGVRSFGCAAMTLCYMAMGGIDGYQIDGLHCWDVAAGVLILREAGGTVLDTNGGDFQLMEQRILCAGTRQLANELVNLLRTADLSLKLK